MMFMEIREIDEIQEEKNDRTKYLDLKADMEEAMKIGEEIWNQMCEKIEKRNNI